MIPVIGVVNRLKLYFTDWFHTAEHF